MPGLKKTKRPNKRPRNKRAYPMIRTLTFLLIGAASVGALTSSTSFGATIPAGTTLTVRTLNDIWSVSTPGTAVRARLTKDVSINGKVLLPAGTEFSGEVVTSKRTTASKQKLTVDINAVKVGGRSLPIKTTGAYRVDDSVYKTTRRNISITTHGYPVPAGLTMGFKLAQPLQL
jgi:hypothetical protein